MLITAIVVHHYKVAVEVVFLQVGKVFLATHNYFRLLNTTHDTPLT